MSVKIENFGVLDNGEFVKQLFITNKYGNQLRLITYGAAITHLFVMAKDNNKIDVVLGYDRIDNYCEGTDALGAVVGRFANRIKDAQFKIDNIQYNVTANNGRNSLHSGPSNFIKKNFKYYILDENSVRFEATSVDLEEGFPGEFKLIVDYSFNDLNQVSIKYVGTTNKATPINITNHAFFNLNGHNSGIATNHSLLINSETYTLNDETSVPTGEFISVNDTPFDFRELTLINKHLFDNDAQLNFGLGYDQNFVLCKNLKNKRIFDAEFAAQLIGNQTGIVMNTYTTQPGIQLYSANHLSGRIQGKEGANYDKHHGICLETQHYPASPAYPTFPNVILRPNEIYTETTIYEFNQGVM